MRRRAVRKLNGSNMAYSKKKHLQDNILAIQTVFKIQTENREASVEEISILNKYSGFGGLKCILRPCDNADDKNTWPVSEQNLFDDTRLLYSIIRQYSKSKEECKTYRDSLRHSILSAFYTPEAIPQAINKALSGCGIKATKILDPCAGAGAFVKAFKPAAYCSVYCYEKDLLTAEILSVLQPKDIVFAKGFETIDERSLNHFDIIASNIPFGDYRIYDPSFANSKDESRKRSCKDIHSYFFIKAVDAVRDGGIVAFITSQGVMNSSHNEYLRNWLMDRCNLITAIRLPDNLFIDSSNTEAPSDLVILQKKITKMEHSIRENSFTQTRNLGGIHINNYYMDFSRVIHTSVSKGKNQYGQPAFNFLYENGMDELALDLYEKIREDCLMFLDLVLYKQFMESDQLPIKTEARAEIAEVGEPEETEAPEQEFSLYDLFDIPPEERTQINRKQQIRISDNTSKGSESISISMIIEGDVSIRTKSMEPRLYEGVLMEYYKDGILVENQEQVGILSIKMEWNPKKHCEDKVYTFTPLKVSPDIAERYKTYFALREAYFFLHNTETVNKREYPDPRKQLNDRYREFTEKYGDINSKENHKLLKQDLFGDEILGLEYYENGKKQLADIFYRPVAFMPDTALQVKKADEALAASMNKFDCVNLDYMSAICGKDEKELIRELENVIFYNPLLEVYEISSRFIAGDVIAKSEQLEEFIQNNPTCSNSEECHKSLEALKTAIPKAIPFSELDFNLGERWLPTSYYNEYVTKIFNTEVTINYLVDIDDFHIVAKNMSTAEITEKYAVKPDYSNAVTGLVLLSHALVNTFPKITKPSGRYNAEGKEIRIPDLEAIQQANIKIDEIRSGFTDYLNNLPLETKNELSKLYNRKFNARVKPHYDGKFQTFPDLHLHNLGIEKLYDSQYDAIWMLKSCFGGICDHEVGAGKTLTICVTAHEMKRLKLAHKPMIIGLKTNIFAIADTYRKAYPNDKVLYPSEYDFEPKNRLRLFNKIKNNDWDTIILTHEQFFKIPQSLEIQQTTLQKELDSVEENLRVYEKVNKVSASSGMLKGLEKRQTNLKAALQELYEKMEDRRDDTVDFRTMGIDHIFVDESAEFKNLCFNTRYRYVAGLGDPKGSQRALNLLYAIRTIQYMKDKDLCATFLSGTTISNSLVELYLLFKYLRPRAMEDQGIRTFDAWAAVYAKKTSDFEFTVTNEIKSKERFRYFKNVPELANFYMEICDYRKAADIGIDRPENNIILYTTRSTPEQGEFQKRLIEFAKNGNGELIDRPFKNYDKKDSGRMLVVTDLGKKISLDVRLVDPEKYNDHPDNKLSQAAKNIADYYHKYDEQRGTQFVFCDIGTYNPTDPHKWSIYGELKRKLLKDYFRLYNIQLSTLQKNCLVFQFWIHSFR